MTYINFDSSNDKNIELVERRFNIGRLNCKTIILDDKMHNKFEEIEKTASISPRGVFIDVTGLNVMQMAYLNTVNALLDRLGYVPMIVAVNDKGKLIELSNHYKFNDLANIDEAYEYLKLVRRGDNLYNEIYGL